MKFLLSMGCCTIKAQRAAGRQVFVSEDGSPIPVADATMDDSMSETRPVTESEDSGSDEEEAVSGKSNRRALTENLLKKRKEAPKCIMCNKGFVMSKKTFIQCAICSSYLHKRHLPPREITDAYHCSACRRPSSTPAMAVDSIPDISSVVSIVSVSTGQSSGNTIIFSKCKIFLCTLLTWLNVA